MILCNSLCDYNHISVEELRIIFKPVLSVILVRCADAQRYVSIYPYMCVHMCVGCVSVSVCLCVCVSVCVHVCVCMCLCVRAICFHACACFLV